MNVLEELKVFYNNAKIEKGYIGSTGKGKLIPFFAISYTARPRVIFTYAIHAREYITTYLALEQIKKFVADGKVGTAYFIPAINLDGIEIVLKDKPLYKANAFGVDLNVNFDARWGTGEKNVKTAGDENYIGAFAFSESETRALRDFTLLIRPDTTVSYHSKGEEIYYEFFQDEIAKKRDRALAEAVANKTGYKIKSTPFSCGGYKDWCIERLKIPALTIEVGEDSLSHPIKKEYLPQIFAKNKDVVNVITEHEIWKKNLCDLP